MLMRNRLYNMLDYMPLIMIVSCLLITTPLRFLAFAVFLLSTVFYVVYTLHAQILLLCENITRRRAALSWVLAMLTFVLCVVLALTTL